MPKLSPDKKWKSLNKKLEKSMISSNFFAIGTIYYEMADFLKKEGKDDSNMRRLGYEMKLKHNTNSFDSYLKSGVVKGVEVLTSHDPCNFCKNLSGKVFTIGNAMHTKPIPIEQCTHKYGCRCTYIPVI